MQAVALPTAIHYDALAFSVQDGLLYAISVPLLDQHPKLLRLSSSGKIMATINIKGIKPLYIVTRHWRHSITFYYYFLEGAGKGWEFLAGTMDVRGDFYLMRKGSTSLYVIDGRQAILVPSSESQATISFKSVWPIQGLACCFTPCLLLI